MPEALQLEGKKKIFTSRFQIFEKYLQFLQIKVFDYTKNKKNRFNI